jgi:hypothetical protein
MRVTLFSFVVLPFFSFGAGGWWADLTRRDKNDFGIFHTAQFQSRFYLDVSGQ